VAVILGWDIGGVNTKAVRLDGGGALTARSRSFELQRDPDALVRVLTGLAGELGVAPHDAFTCAATMTAELSQMFRTKRDGVAFVLDAVSTAFPVADIRVFTTDGRFVPVQQARQEPMAVAAANWAATARLVAERFPTALLMDVGTTTTDVIPIVDGRVVSTGMTDPERLASGELVYTGALRTPVEAIVHDVPYRNGTAAVSAEGFALVGDVHLWRGSLAVADYTVPTPDGRAPNREFAAERIARVVCADRELLDELAIGRIAASIAAQQVAIVAAAIRRVRARHASIRIAVITGLGEFIAREAAQAEGLDVVSLAGQLGPDASRYAPAAAVALLVRSARLQSDHGGPADVGPAKAGHDKFGSIDLVIKVGGGLLAHADHLDRVLASIADVARTRRVLVVPGGGPFADVVRDVDGRLGIGNDAAHWMAILGMDQYAHLLASRMADGYVVCDRDEIEAAHVRRQIPVLAPFRWLDAADPLPHTWEVTGDSIAAWIAGEVHASRLVLVKPPGARGSTLVDAHFEHALSPGVSCDCLGADEAIELLRQQAALMARSI
jgi:probable H4MPT-linked C1 transfer pathway protein